MVYMGDRSVGDMAGEAGWVWGVWARRTLLPGRGSSTGADADDAPAPAPAPAPAAAEAGAGAGAVHSAPTTPTLRIITAVGPVKYPAAFHPAIS